MIVQNAVAVGELLRGARRRKRLSQQQLADLVGVSRQWVISAEGGAPPPLDLTSSSPLCATQTCWSTWSRTTPRPILTPSSGRWTTTLSESLDVRLVGQLAGTLTSDAGSISFVYDEAYQADRTTPPLSVSMPKVQREHGDDVAAPWIDNLLPDSDAVRQRWAAEFGIRRVNAFALLRHTGEDCAGAVQIVSTGDLPAIRRRDSPGRGSVRPTYCTGWNRPAPPSGGFVSGARDVARTEISVRRRTVRPRCA